jgi:hypothetical protein
MEHDIWPLVRAEMSLHKEARATLHVNSRRAMAAHAKALLAIATEHRDVLAEVEGDIQPSQLALQALSLNADLWNNQQYRARLTQASAYLERISRTS